MASSTNHAVSGNQCLYTNVTAGTSLIKTGPGVIYGFTVNSHTSGVVKLFDGVVASGQVMFNSISLAAGERFVNLGGVCFGTGCTASIGGTADITFHFR